MAKERIIEGAKQTGTSSWLIPLAGTFDQPPIEGTRTLENSPQLFPHLSPGGCEFLYEVAQVAIFLEQQLSLRLTPTSQNRLYIPLSIQRVVDIAEGLVRTPETAFLSPGKDVVGLDSRNYFLRYVAENKVNTYEGGKNCHRLDAVEMSFFSNGGSQGSQDVQISLRPNTTRKIFAANGKSIGHLEGIPKTEVEEIISYRGWSPEEALQIAETQEVAYPTFTIISGGAKLQMVFCGEIAHCELSIEGKDYERRSAYTVLPLTKFRRFKHDNNLSQGAIDRWLNAIASELVKEAEKAMTAKKTKRRATQKPAFAGSILIA